MRAAVSSWGWSSGSFLVLLLLAGEASADGIGAVAGLDVVELTGDIPPVDSTLRLRPLLGAFYRWERGVMLDVGITYVRRQVDFDCGDRGCNEWIFDDLEIPIVGRLPLVTGDLRVLVHGALVPWIVVRKRSVRQGKTDDLDSITDYDVALAGGLGADYRVGRTRYGIELRGSVGVGGRAGPGYRDLEATSYAGYLLFTVVRER